MSMEEKLVAAVKHLLAVTAGKEHGGAEATNAHLESLNEVPAKVEPVPEVK